MWCDPFVISGKYALLTGATGGIGRAILEAFLGAGAHVIAVTRQKNADWGKLQREYAGFLHPTLCDLANADEVLAMAENIKSAFPSLEVLINNACPNNLHIDTPYSIKTFEAIRKVGLDAPYILCGILAPLMAERGQGSIINITSINAEAAWPNNPAYVATKSGLRMLTKAVARDFGAHGVRANNVSPGYVHTRMTTQSFSDPDAYRRRSDKTMLGRWGKPEEIANVCIFLASEASSYITGSDIHVDGGWLAKGF